MKKFLIVLLALAVLATGAFAKAKQDSGLIKVGIVNNPPSESGYRAAN